MQFVIHPGFISIILLARLLFPPPTRTPVFRPKKRQPITKFVRKSGFVKKSITIAPHFIKNSVIIAPNN